MNNDRDSCKPTPAQEAARFKPGCPPGPGRPKGCTQGRQASLDLLDQIAGEPECQAAMGEAIREFILKEPLRAFQKLIMPLLPRQMKLDSREPKVVVWKSLLATYGNPAAAEPVSDAGTEE